MNKNRLLAVEGALLSTGALGQTKPIFTPLMATTARTHAFDAAASKESMRQQVMADMQKVWCTGVPVQLVRSSCGPSMRVRRQ